MVRYDIPESQLIMQLHDDPLIMLGVACSCFIVPSGGAWYILNISCRSVASLLENSITKYSCS